MQCFCSARAIFDHNRDLVFEDLLLFHEILKCDVEQHL